MDGIVGRNTIAALFDGKQSSSSTTKKPTSPKTPNSSTGSKVPITPTLRVGSRGSQVKALQNKLNALGFNCGKADGTFGSRTRTAVRNFQRSKGLSGWNIGRNTINALYSNNGQSSGSSTPKETKYS